MTKEFWKAAGIRALKTICQTAIAIIGVATVVQDVDWLYLLSASALAGLMSLLTSIMWGLPEIDDKVQIVEEKKKETKKKAK